MIGIATRPSPGTGKPPTPARPPRCSRLGEQAIVGEGTPKDYGQAREWYQKAAEAGEGVARDDAQHSPGTAKPGDARRRRPSGGIFYKLRLMCFSFVGASPPYLSLLPRAFFFDV
jgi:hypothetical protein